MSTRLSLRAHLLMGAALWTIGLFGLAGVTWHVLLGHRRPPAAFLFAISHPEVMSLVCIGCLLAGLAQVRRGLSPVTGLRTRLVALREGRHHRLEGEYPGEIAPLVADLNALLDQRDQTVSRARAKAGDLAHGLKTPLAVLTQEAEQAAADGHVELAATIQQQVDRMRRQVDHHLAQARADASARSSSSPIVLVRASAEALTRTLLRLHADRGLHIAVDVPAELQVRVHREDLDELLGNLLDNAWKWARTRVRITAALDNGCIVVHVEDDGAGLPASMRAAVLGRGIRADEAAPGSGLGLSIVRDLAEAYGGSVTLDASPMGGLRASLTLPQG